jgi:hypothetical protein
VPDEVVSKSRFAELAGVSRVRISQWLAEGKIRDDALVGRGRHAKVRVAVALKQLRRYLDPVQHLANGRARLNADDDAAPLNGESAIEDLIKQERLQQLVLGNAAARLSAGIQSGHYTRVEDFRQQLGRASTRQQAAFESAFPEFAMAIITAKPQTTSEVQKVLREVWRTVRERQAAALGTEIMLLPAMLDAEDDSDVSRQSR